MKDERDRVYSSWRLSITKLKSRRNTFKSLWKSEARLKLDYLKKHDYGLYFKLISKNEFNDYLLKVQKEANDLYERLVEEYKIKWNITEELKQNDQMKWVQMMNNIKSCVDEIVYKTLLN